MKTLPIEQQIANLELSKQLAELMGDNAPESVWYWRLPNEPHRAEIAGARLKLHPSLGGINLKDKWFDAYPAYTTAELGVMLPNERDDKYAFFSGLAINGWFCEIKNYKVMPYERLHVELQHDTEANARAACLIYLLTHNLLDNN